MTIYFTESVCHIFLIYFLCFILKILETIITVYWTVDFLFCTKISVISLISLSIFRLKPKLRPKLKLERSFIKALIIFLDKNLLKKNHWFVCFKDNSRPGFMFITRFLQPTLGYHGFSWYTHLRITYKVPKSLIPSTLMCRFSRVPVAKLSHTDGLKSLSAANSRCWWFFFALHFKHFFCFFFILIKRHRESLWEWINLIVVKK